MPKSTHTRRTYFDVPNIECSELAEIVKDFAVKRKGGPVLVVTEITRDRLYAIENPLNGKEVHARIDFGNSVKHLSVDYSFAAAMRAALNGRRLAYGERTVNIRRNSA